MKKVIFLVVFFVSLAGARGQEILIPDQWESSLNISKNTKFALLSGDEFPKSDDFSISGGQDINFGYTNKNLWFQLKLKNQENPKSLILQIQHTLSGQIDFYEMRDGKPELLGQSGSAVNWNERTLPSVHPAIKMNFESHESKVILIKRKSHHRFNGKILITTEELFSNSNFNLLAIILFYTGSISALLIYNLFLGVYTGKKTYLYYSLFLFTMGVLVLNVQGALDYVFNFFPRNPSSYLLMFSSLTTLCSLVFANRFLKGMQLFPKFRFVYKSLFILLLSHILLYPFLSPLIGAYMGYSIDITIILTLLILLLLGTLSLLNKNPMGIFYMISWAGIFTGAFFWFGCYYNFFPDNLFTHSALLWGNVIEMLVISLGLAYQMTITDREKQEAELKASGNEKYRLFSRVLLHDISNPVQLIVNYCSLLQRNNSLDGKAKELAVKIQKASMVITDIIHSIKKQKALSSDKIVAELEIVDLREVVEDCLFFYQQKIENKNLEIIRPKAYPKVMAEKSLLINSVVSNAISNAIKFSHPGGTITINCKDSGITATMSIEDQGIGISMQEINEFNANGLIKSRPGTLGEVGMGYGLHLMKTYMKAINGEMCITSCSGENDKEDKKGTRVMFEFKTPD